jgi:hypothetical protein
VTRDLDAELVFVLNTTPTIGILGSVEGERLVDSIYNIFGA